MSDLVSAIRSKRFTLSIIGLGRVGLPLAVSFSNRGVRKVYGVDKNEDLIRKLHSDIMPFEEENLLNEWNRSKRRGNLIVTMPDHQVVRESQIIMITVNTPLSNNFKPDMSQVLSVINHITSALQENTLIIFRSTLSPTVADDIFIPRLNQTGKSVRVAVCPERIVEGQAFKELRELPEIVGANDLETQLMAKELFQLLGKRKQIILTDTRSAEMAKIFSNVYRYVNFALANELAILAEGAGLDGRAIIEMANRGYKRGGISKPAPSGGPCLFKDGHFLVGSLSYIDFIRAAWHLNESIPKYIVLRIKDEVGSLLDKKVGLLGVSYKRGSDDLRYSPAVDIAECLEDEGAEVYVHDPHIQGTKPLEKVLDCEIIVLGTNHDEFKEIPIERLRNAKLFYDCWGIFLERKGEFEKYHIKYRAFGAAC